MSAVSDKAQLETQRVRTHILSRFLEAQPQYVSGGELAKELKMTRTAVWKHIQTLQDLGFSFEAAPRRGYRLMDSPDLVLEPLLRPLLAPAAELGQRVYWYPSLPSTNRLASDLAQDDSIPHGCVITAKEQVSGRGRQGKQWASPAGGLWLSVILKRPVPLARAAELTLMASVAVLRAVRQVTGVSLAIKWPNDLLFQGKKVCGILAELRAGGESVNHAILGIGLNANVPVDSLPKEVRNIATSLSIASGQECSTLQLTRHILGEFEAMYLSLVQGEAGFKGVVEEWRRNCVTLGQEIRVQTPAGLVTGLARRVDDQGVLYIQPDSSREIAIHSGEVLF